MERKIDFVMRFSVQLVFATLTLMSFVFELCSFALFAFAQKDWG